MTRLTMQELQVQFEAAFNAHNDELFRYASMRVNDRERALELTQECFVKAFEYAKRGNTIDDLRPFLYRTLRNLIIDEYRKKKATSLEQMVEGDEGGDVEALMPVDESNTLEAAIDRFDGKRALAALNELPDLYREAVSLRYIEGLTPQEIAAIVGESQTTVSVRVHRGLKKLRDLLDHDTA
ncbi:RNA polymerase sigma factor [Candidatus Nomurabacteria bacterium]|nr:RNA polymerase sigma factor [Candidatus Nomurabacteria bacterium]